ncbi:hypothetical protein DFH08DRAFT_820401 [Mycena albidolilacea]|uniref:Uncharacterized protein n=1 Tax=Mycena albidolilacea TaxID=1033008 RepID=A0AAD7EFB0_9AGAR|nr:hypothetical protein DFH08DRAFT_820401 [Mycena albidolilacea]
MSEETHVHIRTWVCRDDPPSPHLTQITDSLRRIADESFRIKEEEERSTREEPEYCRLSTKVGCHLSLNLWSKVYSTRGWGGFRPGSDNKTNTEKARRAALSRGAMAPPMQPQPAAPTMNTVTQASSTQLPSAAFFTPRDSNRPDPLGNPKPTPTQTGRASFWSTVDVSHVEASASGSATNTEHDTTVFSPMNPLRLMGGMCSEYASNVCMDQEEPDDLGGFQRFNF